MQDICKEEKIPGIKKFGQRHKKVDENKVSINVEEFVAGKQNEKVLKSLRESSKICIMVGYGIT